MPWLLTLLQLQQHLLHFQHPVTQHGGFLEVQLGCGLVHLLLKFLLQLVQFLDVHGFRVLLEILIALNRRLGEMFIRDRSGK